MLHIFDSIRGISFAAVLIKLLLAFAIGTIIGLERSYHNKPAGFRTHILVVLGASIASLTGIFPQMCPASRRAWLPVLASSAPARSLLPAN